MLILKGHRGRLRCLAFSPDGRFLASAAGGGTAVSLWDAARGKRLGFLSGHGHRVVCLAFAPGSEGVLASAALHGRVCLWDPSLRQLQATLPNQGNNQALGFSPDGRTLAVAGHRWPGYAVELLEATGGKGRKSL